MLGLSTLNLEEEIVLHSEDINARDCELGRTPLAWAAARGDKRAVVSHGADPNILDCHSSGAVSNAAAQGHTVCVRLLLEAGACPNPPTVQGREKLRGRAKVGCPLNCAAPNATDVLLLKTLLDFGAQVDASGVDRNTGRIYAARTDNASFAVLLLEYSADINAKSTCGATPLSTAIVYNSHNVLRLILARGHEYSDIDRGPEPLARGFSREHYGPGLERSLLRQTAALYADIETLTILAVTDSYLWPKHKKNYVLRDLESRLHRRPDCTQELVWTFDNLLSSVNEIGLRRETTECRMKPSRLPSFLSRVENIMAKVG